MKQIAFASAIMLILSGCRAPMPSFDLLAPYGTSRVPAPGTGTIGTGGAYYSPANNAPVGTGFRPATIRKPTNKWSSLGEPTEGKVAGDADWSPTRAEPSQPRVVDLDDIDVALARQQPTARVIPASRVTEHRGPIRIVQPSSVSGGSGTVLRGLPTSAAVSRSPRTFVPSGQVVDITALPLRASSTRTVPAPTSASTSQGGSTVSSNGWRSRT